MCDARHGGPDRRPAHSLQFIGDNIATTRSKTMKTEQVQSSDKISDKELDNVTGGRKAGEGQKDFLVVKMKEAFVASYSL